jgi:uncharacterized membrane protein HdeD (DUF308 family)
MRVSAPSLSDTPPPARQDFANDWSMLRGITAIVFGMLALAWTDITQLMLVLFFGAYALADGIFALIAAGARREDPQSQLWLGTIGVCGIVTALFTLLWPGLTAMTLLLVIAGWAVATGAAEIVGGILIRQRADQEWMLIASGALSVVIGLALAAQPDAGAVALVWLIGATATVQGILEVTASLRLRDRYRVALRPRRLGK